MLEYFLAVLVSFLLLVAVHIWDVDRLKGWTREAEKLLAEWDGLHPVDRLRRGRRLLADYPEPIL